jgi:hypothetical protein
VRAGGSLDARRAQAYTLSEVVALGFEAYHCGEDGVWWLCHGCVGLRSNPLTGERLLISNRDLLPTGPWYPTHWGECELRSARERAPKE